MPDIGSVKVGGGDCHSGASVTESSTGLSEKDRESRLVCLGEQRQKPNTCHNLIPI